LKRFFTIPFFLFFAWTSYAQSGISDAALSSGLSTFRGKDDLSGWIYAQIQWTARAPAKRSGQLVEAVRQAWRGPHSPDEQQAWLDLLTNEGYGLLLSGSIVPSTDAYTAAYDFARLHPAIADAGLVLETVLKPLGNNYTRLGDYEQALYIHQKAAALALALGDREALAGVYSNLANTSGNMGRPLSARDYCRKGLAVARAHSAMAGLLLSELADAYREMDKVDSAKIAIKQSIGILQSAHDHPSAGYWLLMAYQVAGDLCGEPKQALGFYQKAYGLQQRLSRQPGELRQRDRAKLFYRFGAEYAGMGQEAPATRWLDSCLAVLVPGRAISTLRSADLYAENTLADALYVLAGLQKNVDEAIRLYELSFASGKKGRQQLITASSKERWVADSKTRYEKALEVTWAAWNRTRNAKYAYAMLRFMESSKAQLLLDEVLQQRQLRLGKEDTIGLRIRLLENAQAYYRKEMIGGGDSASLSRLRETDWQLANLQKRKAGAVAPEFTPDSLSALLTRGVVARSYFAGEKVLYTIECGGEGIRYVDRRLLDAGWQDSVRAFTRHWFSKGANNMIDHPAAYYSEASGLYERFFAAHPFSPDAAYILLPDGALSLLPVEALIASPAASSGAADPTAVAPPGISPDAPATWPFVIRKAAISYGYSLQTLWQQRERAGGGGFSGFFLSADRRDLPGLQATLAEKSGIEPAVRDGHWYVDSLATTAAFRTALASSSIVHISSHAFTGRDSLDAPHIELFDAPFYLFERFDLLPSLVVLSACRTGDGRYVSGEGVQSLARAFTASGAAAVVAGWWNVNDEAAAKLMADLYKRMAAQSGEPGGAINAAFALRQSKLAWMNDPSRPPVLQLPYYWAALNYQGNPTPFTSGASSGLTVESQFWTRTFRWLASHGVMIGLVMIAGLLLLIGGRHTAFSKH